VILKGRLIDRAQGRCMALAAATAQPPPAIVRPAPPVALLARL
jgi:hypothetical protein